MTRNTIQRTLVLQTVRQLRDHATADEIYGVIAKEHADISKATVYRNLNKLVAEGEIRKRSLPGEPDRFDHNCTNHYHIRCEKCGKVYDVDMEYIEDLAVHIRNRQGFLISTHDIFFSGICPSCQTEEK